MSGVLILLVIVALASLGPLLLIWALNTLFGLSIDYNFWTWCAALILGVALKARIKE